mgnify:CR=1 FL=1
MTKEKMAETPAITGDKKVYYNYKAQKYEVLNVDTEIGNKEITIL